MTGDRVIRFATAAVVCAVAAFAAVVSYSHIYGLGRAHGQDGTAARLLPLSVDGLILAASLVLLHEARNGRDAPGLARFMLWLGIAATIGANIAYGAGYGLLGGADLGLARGGVHRRGGDRHAAGAARPRATRGHQRPAVPEVPGDVEQAVWIGGSCPSRPATGTNRVNRPGGPHWPRGTRPGTGRPAAPTATHTCRSADTRSHSRPISRRAAS